MSCLGIKRPYGCRKFGRPERLVQERRFANRFFDRRCIGIGADKEDGQTDLAQIAPASRAIAAAWVRLRVPSFS